MIKHFLIWKHLNSIAVQISLSTRFGAFFWIFVKLIRFILFFLLLVLIFSKTNTIAGYSFWQVILFYTTFNIIDIFVQFFLREVYRFRSYVVSGHLDTMLLRPYPILFRVLFGGIDILDLPLLIISLGVLIFVSFHIEGIHFINGILYVALILNAFIIAISFHIFVLASGITSTAVDNTIMIYRDVTAMGRLPIEIYREPIRSIITFVIPVGIMITFPAKVLLGLISFEGVFIAVAISFFFLILSLYSWNYAIKQYASASS